VSFTHRLLRLLSPVHFGLEGNRFGHNMAKKRKISLMAVNVSRFLGRPSCSLIIKAIQRYRLVCILYKMKFQVRTKSMNPMLCTIDNNDLACICMGLSIFSSGGISL
jgi:hypothetical protein